MTARRVRAGRVPERAIHRAGGRALAALPLALLSFVPSSGRAAAGVRADLRIVPAFFTGDFGSGVDTDITYIPLVLTARGERNDFRATVPYLSIRSDEPIACSGGDVVGRGAGGSTTESGLGDIVLRDDFFFLPGGARGPWVYASLRLKLPTADETRGLGTGELDYGPGAGLIQPLGAGWHLLGEVLYMVRGDPPGVDFRNTLWIFLGAQARASERARIDVFLDRRQSAVRGREAGLDMGLGYHRRLSEGLDLRSQVFVGLSDTAEDWGLSVGLVLRRSDRRSAPGSRRTEGG
ncbi:MAG: transporter [Acidobacteriota bacterium]